MRRDLGVLQASQAKATAPPTTTIASASAEPKSDDTIDAHMDEGFATPAQHQPQPATAQTDGATSPKSASPARPSPQQKAPLTLDTSSQPTSDQDPTATTQNADLDSLFNSATSPTRDFFSPATDGVPFQNRSPPEANIKPAPSDTNDSSMPDFNFAAFNASMDTTTNDNDNDNNATMAEADDTISSLLPGLESYANATPAEGEQQPPQQQNAANNDNAENGGGDGDGDGDGEDFAMPDFSLSADEQAEVDTAHDQLMANARTSQQAAGNAQINPPANPGNASPPNHNTQAQHMEEDIFQDLMNGKYFDMDDYPPAEDGEGKGGMNQMTEFDASFFDFD